MKAITKPLTITEVNELKGTKVRFDVPRSVFEKSLCEITKVTFKNEFGRYVVANQANIKKFKQKDWTIYVGNDTDGEIVKDSLTYLKKSQLYATPTDLNRISEAKV